MQQTQQIGQHEKTDKHRACVEACYNPVRFCSTCGAVKPLEDHNRSHKISEYTLECEPSYEVDMCKSSKTERIVAQLARSLAPSVAGRLRIGSYCNEHFEQTFGCDYTNFPIGIAKLKVAQCGTCSNLRSIFGCAIKVRQGNLFTIDEAEYRQHIVRDLEFDIPRAKENKTITPAQFGSLSQAEKARWIFNTETFMFELAVGATEEKKTDFVKAFLAGERIGDTTDGAVAAECRTDEEEKEKPQENTEETDDSVLD